MYARITTYRFEVGDRAAADAADPQEAIRLLTELDGCRGAWELAPEGSETEATYFSLWDSKEQAETAGDRVRPKLLEMLAKYQTTITAAPETKILEVLAASEHSVAG
jgi:hypothetical protein